MESTFYKASAIKIRKIKSSTHATGEWIQFIISENEREHMINCFPENGASIPISLPISLHTECEDDA